MILTNFTSLSFYDLHDRLLPHFNEGAGVYFNKFRLCLEHKGSPIAISIIQDLKHVFIT